VEHQFPLGLWLRQILLPDQAQTTASLMVKLLGLRSCAALLTAVTQADQVEVADQAEAEDQAEVMEVTAAEVMEVIPVEVEVTETAMTEVTQDTHEDSSTNQRHGVLRED
jgi:hypothetical protein